jgi:TetR/AcrR family transcriptional repressor of nem operon
MEHSFHNIIFRSRWGPDLMARPVQIDRAQALKAARDVFWRQGYTATSMSQLLETMGIGSGSFYAAFDNKAKLFERVVDDYTQWSMNQFVKVRHDHRGLEAIRAFLNKTLIDISDSARHKGCLLVNSVLELDDVEPRLYEHVHDALGCLEEMIQQCIDEAITMKALRPDIDEHDAVGLLMSLIQGLRVESRLGLGKEEAQSRVNALLRLVSNPHYEDRLHEGKF